MGPLSGHRVLLGISGSIAAYKAPEIARGLATRGARVQAVLTRHAQAFITPLTLEVLTGQSALIEQESFRFTPGARVPHIEAAQAADLLLVAPATANILAKLAYGLADDILSTVALAVDAPLVVAPAMNTRMYEHPRVQENLRRLGEQGVHVVSPTEGALACGVDGVGRMADPADILRVVQTILESSVDLAGTTVLVTAGPTREPLDPIRFLSNYSTGRMGYAVAEAACQRGARVILITGPTDLAAPRDVDVIRVKRAVEMEAAVLECLGRADAVIMTAAVSDYCPVQSLRSKIKKGVQRMTLALAQTPDILESVAKHKDKQVVVGFAAETEEVLPRAREKLQRKGVDLMVANDVSEPGAGFEATTNHVWLLFQDGAVEEVPLAPKAQVAHRILDALKPLLRRPEGALPLSQGECPES